MQQLVQLAKLNRLCETDIALLASKLAESGDKHKRMNNSADLASTGGPASLSTLLCPLYLVALGKTVVKLGVPGRPAGGIDVLAQVPGFKVQLCADEISRSLSSSGYAHFLASDANAPLDRKLFEFRKSQNAVAIPDLAIASLLSKKVAVGLELVGLDVRVANHGNFGGSWDEAKDNSAKFNRVAAELGVKAKCFLTDATLPYQPYIGRGESLIALSMIFEGTKDNWLCEHDRRCYAMASILASSEFVDVPKTDILSVFAANLLSQGSSIDKFWDHIDLLKAANVRDIAATSSGFLDIDLAEIRRTLVKQQSIHLSDSNPFPDTAGVALKKQSGDLVAVGDVVASVRGLERELKNICHELGRAFNYSQSPGKKFGFEVVNHA